MARWAKQEAGYPRYHELEDGTFEAELPDGKKMVAVNDGEPSRRCREQDLDQDLACAWLDEDHKGPHIPMSAGAVAANPHMGVVAEKKTKRTQRRPKTSAKTRAKPEQDATPTRKAGASPIPPPPTREAPKAERSPTKRGT